MTSNSRFLVQIASVPGNQVGQREFEQSRYLHELLVAALINQDNGKVDKPQIKALKKLVPQHEIVLRSGFSQTAQWGLEPNMFIEVHGDQQQARIISALFGEAFCQDGIGIGGENENNQTHSVLIINYDWKNEDERLNFVSFILKHFPNLSAQLDKNGQLTFHDYSMSSENIFSNIISLIKTTNKNYSIEEKQMKSELIDRTKYEDLLTSIQSLNMRHAFHILRQTHARLFAGYGCGSLKLSKFSLKRRQKRHEEKQEKQNKNNLYPLSPSHLCSLIFTSHRPCMCLTNDNCFCHYTLVFTTHVTSSHR